MKKISLSILLMLLAGCGSSQKEKSYLAASSYPEACSDSSYFAPFMSRLETCNSPQLDAASAEFCLASIRPLYDNLPADCRDSLDTRELVGRAVKVFARNGIKNSLAAAVTSPNPSYKGTGGLTYLWLEQFGFLYANAYDLTKPMIEARLGREYALSELTAEILKSVHTISSKNTLTSTQNQAKLPLAEQVIYPQNQSSLQQYVGLLKDGFENYRESKEGPLFTAFVMSQILKSVRADFDSLASIQDMTCSLTICNDVENYPLSQLANLISSIPDSKQYEAAYSKATSSGQFTHPASPLAQFFLLLKQHPEKVQAAFTICFDKLAISELKNSNLLGVKLESYIDASFVGKDFLETIKSFQTNMQRLKASGFLVNTSEGSISNPLTKDMVQEIQLFVQKSKSDVESKASAYAASRLSLLQTLTAALGDISQKIDNSKIVDNYLAEIELVAKDIAGLQNAIEKQDTSFAEYAAQMDLLINQKTKQNQFSSTLLPTFSVSASQSPYTFGSVSDAVPANYAIKTLDLSAGEMLNVDVIGQWSPTCALRKFPTGIPVNNSTADISSVVTTSEGYSMGFSQGRTFVKSRTEGEREVDYTETSAVANACAKASFSATEVIGTAAGAAVGGPPGAALGREVGKSVNLSTEGSACANFSQGKRNEEFTEKSRTTSDALSSSANFASGLRLPNTPFDKYPAGSLLLFAMNASEPKTFANRAAQVKVLSSRNTIVADRDMTLYFVINDCADGNSSSSSLTVSAQRLKPVSAELQKANAALMKIVRKFHDDAAKTLLEGVDVGDQLVNLKAQANSDALLATTTFAETAELRELFNFWLDHQALQVKRMASIEQKRREVTRIIGEVQRITLKDEGLKATAAARQLQIKFELDNLDSKLLVEPVARLATKMTKEFAAPVTFFFSKSKLSQRLGGSAQDLIGVLSVEKPFLDVAKKTAAFFEAFNTETAGWTNRLDNAENSSTVALRFPHPFREQLDYVDRDPRDGKYVDTLTYLPTASRNLSKSLWEGIFVPKSKSRPVIRPEIEQMFKDAADGFISCNSSSPIIEDMAFMFVASNSDVNIADLRVASRNASVPVFIGPTTVIPTNSGLTEFNMEGGVLGSQVKMGFVTLSEAALGNFDDGIIDGRKSNSGAGRGLSPFTSIEISFQALYDYFQKPDRAITFGVNVNPLTEAEYNKTGMYDLLPDSDVIARPGLTAKEYPSALTDIIVVYRIRTMPATRTSMKYLRACR
jgi:outer membrane lipoprotein SlyB